MNRTKSLISKIVLLGICTAALGACYYGPAYGPGYGPSYYAPGYYAPAPVTGEVVIEGGGYHHWR